jgi:CIC family chloride channel protein
MIGSRRLGRAFSRLVTGLIQRTRASKTSMLLVTGILVGSVTGLAAVAFIRLIDWITWFGFDYLPGLWPEAGRGWLVIVPVLGALLAGPIIAYFAREAKGHGVPEVMQAMALRGGRIRSRVALAKIAASSLCIGTGGSAGREGPIVQVGSTIGSVLGKLLRLSDDRIRNLVACGAAAGVAATFNAPIAGVFFAFEVLVGELGVGLVANVVISAITASVVSQAFLGSDPAFPIPVYALDHPQELWFYVVLGLLAAVIASLFIRMLYTTEDLFDRWRAMPLWIKPAIGGLLLGLLALGYPYLLVQSGVEPGLASLGTPVIQNLPHVFGSGFAAIESVLSSPLPWILVGSLVLLKMLATSLTLGSGNSGGVFAPSLFMGAMLGGFFGVIAEGLFPAVAPHPGACALAGMAAVFAGAARAPLTAFLIAFEMSNAYEMILPLMATTITATVIAPKLSRESIYSLKLARRGIRLRHGRNVDVLDTVQVSEIMETDPPTVQASMSLRRLQRWFVESHHHGALVLDARDKLIGVITLQDLERAIHNVEEWQDTPVESVMTRDLLVAYRDEPIGAALQRLGLRDVGRLAVVDRTDPQILHGVIRRHDIARAYQTGIFRRMDMQDQVTHLSMSRQTGTTAVELIVKSGSRVAGKLVRELELPDGVLLTTRRHGGQRKLLHGNDILEEGDVVFALAEPEQVSELKALFNTLR